MKEDQFDIVYRLLDDDIIDSEDTRCGRVDDIEFEGEPGAKTTIAAILTGSGAWPARLPRLLRPIGEWIFSTRYRTVPWEAVEDIGETVKLKKPGSDFGIGEADVLPRRLVQRIPGS